MRGLCLGKLTHTPSADLCHLRLLHFLLPPPFSLICSCHCIVGFQWKGLKIPREAICSCGALGPAGRWNQMELMWRACSHEISCQFWLGSRAGQKLEFSFHRKFWNSSSQEISSESQQPAKQLEQRGLPYCQGAWDPWLLDWTVQLQVCPRARDPGRQAVKEPRARTRRFSALCQTTRGLLRHQWVNWQKIRWAPDSNLLVGGVPSETYLFSMGISLKWPPSCRVFQFCHIGISQWKTILSENFQTALSESLEKH